MTRKSTSLLYVLICLLPFLSSCELAKGIFKAGMWVGILAVVGIVALVLYIISKMRGNK